ncbi:unnamed protein product [Cylicostephanus goldi]|uniref:Uncharacterized protein n=1 Tax=Cylicostephanus goldi TaxID=71465 RepID=A0A3P6RM71_CYLGO|nr:unnamed protein product [Cylicostephanus goldi]
MQAVPTLHLQRKDVNQPTSICSRRRRDSIKYDVTALQETKNRNSVTHKRKDGTFVILGKKVLNRNVCGIGLSYTHQLATFSTHGKISRQWKVSVINYYSPTEAADEIKLDNFHEEVENAIYKEKSFYKRKAMHDERILENAITRYDWKEREDPTENVRELVERLRSCAEQAALTVKKEVDV